MVKTSTEALSDRDKDILLMIAEFGGKTFTPVLERTYWEGNKMPAQQARDRVQKLIKKYKLLRLAPTGLMKPRNAIAMTENGKKYAEELGIEVGNLFLSPVTIWHGINEQITWFWLRQAGRDVSRTIVKKWAGTHKHTPDLLYFHNGDETKPVYVEIETNAKNKNRYLSIFQNMGADKIYRVLYVFENEKKMLSIGNKLPISDKLMMTNIDDLIANIKKDGKIGAITQNEFIKKIGVKK